MVKRFLRGYALYLKGVVLGFTILVVLAVVLDLIVKI